MTDEIPTPQVHRSILKHCAMSLLIEGTLTGPLGYGLTDCIAHAYSVPATLLAAAAALVVYDLVKEAIFLVSWVRWYRAVTATPPDANGPA